MGLTSGEAVFATGPAAVESKTQANARTGLGLGTIATQAASAVAITGGTLEGVAIGGTTAATACSVDNLKLDGNTLSSTDTNGPVTISPNGTGDINLTGDLDITDGKNLVLDTTTGTQFGTAAAQKLAFHGATPTDQLAHIVDAVTSYTITQSGDSVDRGEIETHLAALGTVINLLIALVEEKGLAATS